MSCNISDALQERIILFYQWRVKRFNSEYNIILPVKSEVVLPVRVMSFYQSESNVILHRESKIGLLLRIQ